MKTCEFCQFGTDECLILKEPIEYEPSGMTIKENCPLHDLLQVSRHKRELVYGKGKSDRDRYAVHTEQTKESDREV